MTAKEIVLHAWVGGIFKACGEPLPANLLGPAARARASWLLSARGEDLAQHAGVVGYRPPMTRGQRFDNWLTVREYARYFGRGTLAAFQDLLRSDRGCAR